VTIAPPSNTAVVGDNDFMYHRVEAVGDGRFEMVPIDSLLSFDPAAHRWHISKGDRAFGEYGRDDIRISISWKAECFHDADDARTFDEHLDDLTFAQVLAMWRADCDAHGVPLPTPPTPWPPPRSPPRSPPPTPAPSPPPDPSLPNQLASFAGALPQVGDAGSSLDQVKAWRGVVRGRSRELTRPAGASHT
jgi:hypothetical protein